MSDHNVPLRVIDSSWTLLEVPETAIQSLMVLKWIDLTLSDLTVGLPFYSSILTKNYVMIIHFVENTPLQQMSAIY